MEGRLWGTTRPPRAQGTRSAQRPGGRDAVPVVAFPDSGLSDSSPGPLRFTFRSLNSAPSRRCLSPASYCPFLSQDKGPDVNPCDASD